MQYTEDDSIQVVRLLESAAGEHEGTPLQVWIARQLIGTPYVAHTLEVNERERLVVNLRQLDCTTYVETVVALTMCVQRGEKTFDAFCRRLQTLRYIGGSEPMYATRLHYFTSWIEDNTRGGICYELQSPEQLFSSVQTVRATYMTDHPERYRMLMADTARLAGIREQQRAITGKSYRYIPQERLGDSEQLRQTIQDGDIIAIITTIGGLDTQHIGIAVWHDDGLHLLNASSIHKQVVEEPMTLQQYLYKHKTMPGIRVVRLGSE